MATLLSSADGNFTSSGTWYLCDSTSELDSEANNTAVGTAYSSNRSSTFTPGAITVDSIAVKVATRASSPSGTFSVSLYDSTGAADVAGTEVTINVSSIQPGLTAALLNGGWYVFKFATPVLLLAATAYRVQAKCSVNGEVTLFRDATATNWSRQLSTTTNQAPASGDKLLAYGYFNSGGSQVIVNVTYDETATTAYGGLSLGFNSNFQLQGSASTNYNLYISGLAMGAASGKRGIEVQSGGVFAFSHPEFPLDSSSTATIQLSVGSNVEYGIEVRSGGQFYAAGAELTYYTAKLASNASAGATSLTTDVSTGWKNGDEIALAPTTRTYSQFEKKSLTANASGTTLTISAITNDHSGTSPTQGELANLTRNVKIRGASSSLQTYINHSTGAIMELYQTELYWMGSSTTNKRGINTDVSSGGAFQLFRCSIHDFEVGNSIGVVTSNSSTGTPTLTQCSFYNTFFGAISCSSTQFIFDQSTVIGCPGSGCNGILLNTITGTLSNSSVSGCNGNGINLGQNGTMIGTFSGNTAHTNNTSGIIIAGVPFGGTISSSTAWRNGAYGLNFATVSVVDTNIETASVFGNATAGINVGFWYNVLCKSVTFNGDSSFAQPYGCGISGPMKNSFISDSTFSATTAHSIADINWNTNYDGYFPNCTFAASTLIANTSTKSSAIFIHMQKYGQVNGDHRAFGRFGNVQTDSSIFSNASPSVKMTPSSATSKLIPDYFSFIWVPVSNGASVTISIKVRKSAVGDGAAYNGNQPRLILRAKPEAGISSNVVIATATNAANGAFETISGTTATVTDDCVLGFYVDCDGTVGWINWDDVVVNVVNNTNGAKYWLDAGPFVVNAMGGLLRHPGMQGGMNG